MRAYRIIAVLLAGAVLTSAPAAGAASRHRDGGQSIVGEHAARRRDGAADGRRAHHSQGAHPHDAERDRSARFPR